MRDLGYLCYTTGVIPAQAGIHVIDVRPLAAHCDVDALLREHDVVRT